MEIIYHREDRSDPVGWEHRRDVSAASRGELLWYFFPVSLGMRSNGEAWETGFSWVPVLHFGLSLLHICESLDGSPEAHAKYGFTESDDTLEFRRRGDVVTVESSFDPTVITCTLAELRIAAKTFVGKVLSELGSVYPALAETGLAAEMASLAEML
jgi:hypothetical protein